MEGQGRPAEPSGATLRRSATAKDTQKKANRKEEDLTAETPTRQPASAKAYGGGRSRYGDGATQRQQRGRREDTEKRQRGLLVKERKRLKDRFRPKNQAGQVGAEAGFGGWGGFKHFEAWQERPICYVPL